MISYDYFSKLISWVGLSIPVFIFLFSNISIIWLFPSFLIVFGLLMEKFLMPKKIKDEGDTIKDSGNIIFYTVIALATFVFLSLVTPSVAKIMGLEITGYDSILFGVMMAIGEEMFFRLAWANLLIQVSHSEIFGALMGAGIFAVYHLAAYGDNPSAMLFVLGAGFTLIYIDLQMHRLSPSMLAHIGNNVLAYSSLTIAGTAGVLFQNGEILLLFGVIALIVYLYWQRGKHK